MFLHCGPSSNVNFQKLKFFGFLTCGSFIICLDHRLDVYIYDYLMKRKLHASAKAFQDEGKVSTDPVGKYICQRKEIHCIL